MLDVEMHINDLAEFVFLGNKNNATIELSLNGIEDNKDLFYFCVDLFCKGLVMMFGENGKVSVDEINLEQFKSLQEKMANAGIAVSLKVYEEEKKESIVDEGPEGEAPDIPVEPEPPVNLSHIESLPCDMGLGEYSFVIRSPPMVYNVSFDIFRNT